MKFGSYKRFRCFTSFLIVFGTVFSSISGAFAFKMVYQSSMAVEKSKIELLGAFPGGQLGAATAAGDLNGDNIEDLIIGSPFATTNGKQWNGAVKVILGGTEGAGGTEATGGTEGADGADGGLSGGLSFELYGDDAGDQLGTAITTGDFNNDNIDDLALGAYNASDSKKRSGKVYIFYGSRDLGSQNMGFTLRGAHTELAGGLDGDSFGIALEAADLNNDGIDDLLVGAPFATVPTARNAGIVYGYFGSTAGLSTAPHTRFYGQKENERFGSVISGGDVNGDNYTDLFISAYTSSNGALKQAGKVYFYKGRGKNIPATIYAPDLKIVGQENFGWFGFSLDTGDVNGDLKDDLAVSSFPYLGNSKKAKISVFYGSNEFDVSADLVVSEPIGEAMPGASVLLNDLNSDGRAEIIIGAPGVSKGKSNDTGDVYVIYGSDSLARAYSIKNRDLGSFIRGENPDDWFGYSLASLDYNNDGLKDLVVGSRYSDTDEAVNNGKVFILLSKTSPYGELRAVFNQTTNQITRGELIHIVVESFDLKNKKADLIADCHEHREFCLFNFMAISAYDDIQLEPVLRLYPDVRQDDKYYEDINAATMLGLVNGYSSEKNSPFHPELPISRIQALKVVFGAADLVPSKYKFELIAMLGSYSNLFKQRSHFSDIDSGIAEMWWYPRYVNFAVDNNIIDKGEFFRPSDNITTEELDDLINRTLKFLSARNEETEA